MRSSEDPNFGDVAALRAKMVLWAKSLTRDDPRTEDLVQMAFVRLLSNRHRAPALAELDPWARTVLLNTFRDDLRQSRRRPMCVEIGDLPLAAPDNPETSTYCRQVFRIVLGLGADFLMAEPDTESATIRSRRFRARRGLHARVAA